MLAALLQGKQASDSTGAIMYMILLLPLPLMFLLRPDRPALCFI
jgi:hypothetical protein